MLADIAKYLRWLWEAIVYPYVITSISNLATDGWEAVCHLKESEIILFCFLWGCSHRSYPVLPSSVAAQRVASAPSSSAAAPSKGRASRRRYDAETDKEEEGGGDEADSEAEASQPGKSDVGGGVARVVAESSTTAAQGRGDSGENVVEASPFIQRRLLFGKKGEVEAWMSSVRSRPLVPRQYPLTISRSLHQLVSIVIGPIQQPTVSTLPTRHPEPQWPPHFLRTGSNAPPTSGGGGPGEPSTDDYSSSSSSVASHSLQHRLGANRKMQPPTRYRQASSVVYQRVSSRNLDFSNSRVAPHLIASITAHHVLSYAATRQKVLVMDLDETLCHASTTTANMAGPPTFSEVIPTASGAELFHVWVRPYARLFLSTAAKLFNLVLFTSASKPYADTILEHIDPEHLLKYRFYRQDCRLVPRGVLRKLCAAASMRGLPSASNPGSSIASQGGKRGNARRTADAYGGHADPLTCIAEGIVRTGMESGGSTTNSDDNRSPSCGESPRRWAVLEAAGAKATTQDVSGARGNSAADLGTSGVGGDVGLPYIEKPVMNESAKVLVKDLRLLKVPPELLVMIDNCEECLLVNPENALVVPPYIPALPRGHSEKMMPSLSLHESGKRRSHILRTSRIGEPSGASGGGGPSSHGSSVEDHAEVGGVKAGGSVGDDDESAGGVTNDSVALPDDAAANDGAEEDEVLLALLQLLECLLVVPDVRSILRHDLSMYAWWSRRPTPNLTVCASHRLYRALLACGAANASVLAVTASVEHTVGRRRGAPRALVTSARPYTTIGLLRPSSASFAAARRKTRAEKGATGKATAPTPHRPRQKPASLQNSRRRGHAEVIHAGEQKVGVLPTIGAAQVPSTAAPVTTEKHTQTPLPSSALSLASPQRVVRLGEALQEWATLRNCCRWQQRHAAAAGIARGSADAVRTTALQGGGDAARISNGGGGGGPSSSAIVSAAERTLLLSTLANETGTYPQLYALFYPQGHTSGTSPSASPAPVSRWTIEDASPVVSSEVALVDALTLLRVHQLVAHQSTEALELNNRVWVSTLDELQAQLRADERRGAYTQQSCTNVAQVLHTLVDVYQQLLSTSLRTSATEATAPTGKSSSSRSKHRREQQQETNACCVRVRQALAALVAPVQRLAEKIDAAEVVRACETEKGRADSSVVVDVDDAYGGASARLLVAAVSAVAVEAAATLPRVSPSCLSEDEPAPTAAVVAEWGRWRDAARAHLMTHLKRIEDRINSCGSTAAASTFVDMLRCLRWLEELELVLPASTCNAVSASCQRVLQRACRCAVEDGGPHLFECLCTPVMAAELRGLTPARVTYAQVITDLCAVAAAFLRERPDDVCRLVDRVEAAHVAAVSAMQHRRSTASPSAPPPRPPLHSPLAQLLYGMLCAGFPPDALLTSGLCLTLAPRDAVEVVRALDRFSSSCAAAPLPVRTRGVLVDQVVGMLAQCQRDRSRVVTTALEAMEMGTCAEGSGGAALGGSTRRVFNLRSRMEVGAGDAAMLPNSATMLSARSAEGTPMPSSRSAQRRRHSNAARRKSEGRSTVESISRNSNDEYPSTAAGASLLTPATYRRRVDHLLYVTVESTVECLLRGDVAAVQKLTVALLPLLHSEGGEAAFADALECIWAMFHVRLTEIGCDDVRELAGRRSHRPVGGTTAATTAALTVEMESGLALLPTLFLPRLMESAVKMLGAELVHSNAAGSIGIHASARLTPLSHPAHERGANAHLGSSTAAASAPALIPMSVEELIEVALRLSTASILCGMSADTVAQLTALHNTLHKSQVKMARGGGDGDPTTAVPAAFAVVERLEVLLSQLTHHSQTLVRHPTSAHVRNSGVAVQQLLAVYISSTSAAAKAMASPGMAAQAFDTSTALRYRHYLLTVVHLLYRLRTAYTVEVEPVALRQFRVDVLDPALTAVLRVSPDAASVPRRGSSASGAALCMPLTSLTEIMVVMCVPDSVQHVSPALVRGVVDAVKQHLKQHAAVRPLAEEEEGLPSTMFAVDTATGVLATQLLCAAATLCLRADDALTIMLLQLLDVLGPVLSTTQTMTVLQRWHATGAPLPPPPVLRLVERLVDVLRQDAKALADAAAKGSDAAATHPCGIPLAQRIMLMQTLSAVQRTVETTVDEGEAAELLQLLYRVPYGPLLRACVEPHLLTQRRYTIAECGALVDVVAHLTAGAAGTVTTNPTAVAATTSGGTDATRAKAAASPSRRRWTEEEAEAISLLPRTLAVYVVQTVQLPYEIHDIPALLRGYAALTTERASQQHVLRAFISRTMRAAPALTPGEIVECVEAYCASGVYHQQLYGVLLGRVADLDRKISLELSVRLLQCGTQAGHASVRTVCVTAVQPIFSAQVRGLLQSDPHMLVSVAATALAVLRCLRDCFPHDNIGAAVLANVARYRLDASLSVVKAALELAARRGSADYDVLHTLARHCTERLLPVCSAVELANVVYLLIACGLRSAAVMEAAYQRLGEVVQGMQGSSLAKLAQGLLRASVEPDATAMGLICGRATQLAAVAPAAVASLPLPASAPPAARRRNSKTNPAARSAPTTDSATPATAAATPSLLTARQVCVLLRLLRSVCSRLMTNAITTADALLTYTQVRVMSERSEHDDDAAAAATTLAAAAAGTEETAQDVAPIRKITATSAVCRPPPLFLASLTPYDAEAMLRSILELASTPKQFQPLMRGLADCVASIIHNSAVAHDIHEWSGVSEEGQHHPSCPSSSGVVDHQLNEALLSPSSAASAPPAAAAWQTDLMLLVDLSNLLIRLGEGSHPVVRLLFGLQYDRRSTLLQRALLVKTTKQSLEVVGRAAHPELYQLIVEGELV